MNIANILSMILLLLVSYAYSAPPLRIKERSPLDSISNLFIYFLLPFILGFSLGKPISEIPWQTYLISLSVIGGHVFTTIADYTPDKKAGARTFSVLFGKKAAVIFSSLCQLIPAVVIELTVHNKKASVVVSFLVVASLLFLTELFSLNEKHALIIAKIVVACFILSAIPSLWFSLYQSAGV